MQLQENSDHSYCSRNQQIMIDQSSFVHLIHFLQSATGVQGDLVSLRARKFFNSPIFGQNLPISISATNQLNRQSSKSCLYDVNITFGPATTNIGQLSGFRFCNYSQPHQDSMFSSICVHAGQKMILLSYEQLFALYRLSYFPAKIGIHQFRPKIGLL